jgi:hypothetical protein
MTDPENREGRVTGWNRGSPAQAPIFEKARDYVTKIMPTELGTRARECNVQKSIANWNRHRATAGGGCEG